MSDQTMWVGFAHRAECCRLDGRPSSSPRCWILAYVWNDFWSGDGIYLSPCTAGHRRGPVGNLSPRAGSVKPSRASIIGWGEAFHTFRGGIDPGDHGFRPQGVGVADVWWYF